MKKLLGVINMAPTWSGVLWLLTEVAEHGTTEVGRREARGQLEKMARVADAYVLRERQIQHEGA